MRKNYLYWPKKLYAAIGNSIAICFTKTNSPIAQTRNFQIFHTIYEGRMDYKFS